LLDFSKTFDYEPLFAEKGYPAASITGTVFGSNLVMFTERTVWPRNAYFHHTDDAKLRCSFSSLEETNITELFPTDVANVQD
jgi:hypothetical protein